MIRSISLTAFKPSETLLFGLIFICLSMAWTVPVQAGWQRDMVLGNQGPAQPSAPVYTGPTAEQIAALRKHLANHPESFTEPDILAVPADAELPGGEAAPPKPGEAAKPAASPKG